MATGRTSVALLGATGSIGTQTLDVLRRAPERFDLVAVAAGERLAALADVVREFHVPHVAVVSDDHAARLADLVGAGVEIHVGAAGLADLASRADVVVNAVVGFAGLPATLAALEAGRRLALANKESLVAAAPIVNAVRARSAGEILPVDSEHCAIHQCLRAASGDAGHPDVARLVLTASGGPFRGWSADRLRVATKGDALRHPTWSMGDKITIDSSTLMNKGLEVLEAAALFGIDVDRIDVVVHPQSIVHSMVEFVDGSTLAQLSEPDMRLPIAYCLGLPERLGHRYGRLDVARPFSLDFEPPDRENFPALDLAYAAGRLGGAAPAWLNAANEVAVRAFLDDRIAWCEVVPIVASAMASFEPTDLATVEDVVAADAAARRVAGSLIP